MAHSNRGRKAAAERLGLIDDASRGGRPGSSSGSEVDDYLDRAGAGKGSGRSKPTPKARSKRGSSLPSDRTIVGTVVMRVLRWAARLLLFFLVASIGMVALYRYVNPPITPLMLIRPLEMMGEGQLTGIDKQWIPIDEISPVLLRSVMASEDSRFLQHGGVDWKAVEQAEKRNEKAKGRKVWGASTITMQCARNVFLWQGRNYIRKGLEVYFTYLMETLWSKRRIMEVYLNVIEWGDGIYGVEAAAQEYFGVSSSQLTSRQAALLTAVLPNPRRYDAEHPSGYVNGRASTIQARAPLVDLDGIVDTPKAAKKTTSKKRK